MESKLTTVLVVDIKSVQLICYQVSGKANSKFMLIFESFSGLRAAEEVRKCSGTNSNEFSLLLGRILNGKARRVQSGAGE